jgi:hypothetical protein
MNAIYGDKGTTKVVTTDFGRGRIKALFQILGEEGQKRYYVFWERKNKSVTTIFGEGIDTWKELFIHGIF